MRSQVQQSGVRVPSEWEGGTVVAFDRARGGDREAEHLLELVAAERGVPAALLVHDSRCQARIAEARQIAMYLMHVVLRRKYADFGAFFGRDRTTVSHACALIEDRRDNSRFDAGVSRLEAALLGVASVPDGGLRRAAS